MVARLLAETYHGSNFFFHPTYTFDLNRHHEQKNHPDLTSKARNLWLFKSKAENASWAEVFPAFFYTPFFFFFFRARQREKHMPITWRAVCIHPQTYRQIFLPPLPVSLQRVLYWAYVSLADCLAVLVWNNQCQGECICFTRNRFNPSERLRSCPTHPPWNGSWCTEWPNDMDVTFS